MSIAESQSRFSVFLNNMCHNKADCDVKQSISILDYSDEDDDSDVSLPPALPKLNSKPPAKPKATPSKPIYSMFSSSAMSCVVGFFVPLYL